MCQNKCTIRLVHCYRWRSPLGALNVKNPLPDGNSSMGSVPSVCDDIRSWPHPCSCALHFPAHINAWTVWKWAYGFKNLLAFHSALQGDKRQPCLQSSWQRWNVRMAGNVLTAAAEIHRVGLLEHQRSFAGLPSREKQSKTQKFGDSEHVIGLP